MSINNKFLYEKLLPGRWHHIVCFCKYFHVCFSMSLSWEHKWKYVKKTHVVLSSTLPSLAIAWYNGKLKIRIKFLKKINFLFIFLEVHCTQINYLYFDLKKVFDSSIFSAFLEKYNTYNSNVQFLKVLRIFPNITKNIK